MYHVITYLIPRFTKGTFNPFLTRLDLFFIVLAGRERGKSILRAEKINKTEVYK